MSTASHSSGHSALESRRGIAIALAAITLLAIGLRLVGIGFLLPHSWEPDQRVFSAQVELLRNGDPHPELHVDFGWYPLLVARIVALLPAPTADVPAKTLEEHLDEAGAPRRQIRHVIALLSALIAPATYCLARRFLRSRYALVAALLAATSVFHLWFSQQTRPHGVAGALIAWALVGALLVRRRGDALAYLAAGALLGLAVSSLQSGLAALPPLLVAHVLCRRGRFWTRSAWLLVGLVLAFLAVRVFYPFVFLPSGGEGVDAAQFGIEEGKFNLSGHPLFFSALNGRGFGVLAQAFWSYDPLLLALAIGGVGVLALRARRSFSLARRNSQRTRLGLLLRRRADTCVVLAFVIPFVLTFGVYGLTFARFALPLVPIAACCAALLVSEVDRSTSLTAKARSRLRMAARAAIALQVLCAMRLAEIRSQPDTAQLAARWIEDHVDREREHIAVEPGFDLPLFRDAASLDEYGPIVGFHHYPWVNYQVAASRAHELAPSWSISNPKVVPLESRELLARDPKAWIRSLHADWAVIALCNEGEGVALENMRKAVTAEGRLAARFSPLACDWGDDAPLIYQDDLETRKSCLWWRVLAGARMGPVIEIRRLSKS